MDVSLYPPGREYALREEIVGLVEAMSFSWLDGHCPARICLDEVFNIRTSFLFSFF